MIEITPAVPDPPELGNRLWERFSPAKVAFDVGANCGQTVQNLRMFSDAVVAFEPHETAAAYLSDLGGQWPWFRVVPMAVSDRTGSIPLMALPGKVDTGQLVTSGTEGMEWSGDLALGEVWDVPATTLDDWATENNVWPTFLKIDVEGHELQVLNGATAVLEGLPEMLIEIHSEALGVAIMDKLSERYEIQIVRHPHYATGSTLWKTHFWMRCFPFRTGS